MTVSAIAVVPRHGAGISAEPGYVLPYRRVAGAAHHSLRIGPIFADTSSIAEGCCGRRKYIGGRSADAADANCHKAGWSMRKAAREIADALAARAR